MTLILILTTLPKMIPLDLITHSICFRKKPLKPRIGATLMLLTTGLFQSLYMEASTTELAIDHDATQLGLNPAIYFKSGPTAAKNISPVIINNLTYCRHIYLLKSLGNEIIKLLLIPDAGIPSTYKLNKKNPVRDKFLPDTFYQYHIVKLTSEGDAKSLIKLKEKKREPYRSGNADSRKERFHTYRVLDSLANEANPFGETRKKEIREKDKYLNSRVEPVFNQEFTRLGKNARVHCDAFRNGAFINGFDVITPDPRKFLDTIWILERNGCSRLFTSLLLRSNRNHLERQDLRYDQATKCLSFTPNPSRQYRISREGRSFIVLNETNREGQSVEADYTILDKLSLGTEAYHGVNPGTFIQRPQQPAPRLPYSSTLFPAGSKPFFVMPQYPVTSSCPGIKAPFPSQAATGKNTMTIESEDTLQNIGTWGKAPQ